jgi:TRAP-type C4-dicarboxylate transport system substrate-binding protein
MKRFLYPLITGVVVVSLMLGVFCYVEAASAKEKPITIIEASWMPTKMPPPIEWEPFDFVVNEWMDTIERKTRGRVKFDRYPAETLVKMSDHWEAVKGGICDIGFVNVCVFPGQFPMTAALRLPGFFDNAIQGSIVRQELLEEGYLAHEWKDVKVLWMGNNAPWDVSCRKKQIRTLEDLKGLKVATVGEPEISFLKALGAVPIGIPPTEFYLGLERGTVDAAWQDTNGQVAFKLYEVSPYITRIPGNGNAAVVAVMNRDKYNNLPPDIKEIFDKTIGMLGAIMHGTRFDYNYEKCVDFLNKRKDYPPVYVLSPEERARWFKAGEHLIEKAVTDLEAKGLPAREMFKRAHELVEIYRKRGF